MDVLDKKSQVPISRNIMKIIGVNISHDTSLAQITDGDIDFICDEARYRRSKYWSPQATGMMKEGQAAQVGMVSIIHKDIKDVDKLIFASFDRRQFEVEWGGEGACRR